MNCYKLDELEGDDFFTLGRHFFIIEDIIKSDNDLPSEIIFLNAKRKVKLEFFFEDYDIIYGNLIYHPDDQQSNFTLESLRGKHVVIDFIRRKSRLQIASISFYNNTYKNQFPQQYFDLVSFSSQHINWFLEGLAKHEGIIHDLLRFIKKGENVKFGPVFVLNKLLSLADIDSDLIEYNEEYLAQNQSSHLWNSLILDKLFQRIDDFMYGYNEKKRIKLQTILSRNKALINNDVVLIQNISYFNWDVISASQDVKWNIEKILVFRECLNWDILSSNPYLPWSKDLLQTFSNKWNWQILSKNRGINWNLTLLNAFSQSRDWDFNKINHAYLTENILDVKTCDWDWDNLSKNHELPWSEQFIRKYKENWNWSILCQNESINWSTTMLLEYNSLIDWNSFSQNSGNFWEKEMIIQNFTHLNWSLLSTNSGLPWSKEIFDLLIKLHRLKYEYNSSNIVEPFDDENYDPYGSGGKNSDYYVDPDTDIVFIQGSPSLDQIIQEYQDNEDKEALYYMSNYYPSDEELFKENPLLEETIWRKFYSAFLCEEFIYNVLISGVQFESPILEADFSQ